MVGAKTARENAGLSLEEAAMLIGISKTALSEIESGKRELSPMTIFKMMKAYDAKMDQIIDVQLAEKRMDQIEKHLDEFDDKLKKAFSLINKLEVKDD